MNSMGFLKRRKHDTKKASAPPSLHLYHLQIWGRGGTSARLQLRGSPEALTAWGVIWNMPDPTLDNPISSEPNPASPLSLSPHSPDNTEFIAFHTHPAAWSQGHLRQGRIYPADSRVSLRETAASHNNEPVKSTFKKMCKLRFPFRSANRILQKGRQKIQAWKKGLKAVGVSDGVMIRF